MAINLKKRFNQFMSDWNERLMYEGYTYKELCAAAGGGDGGDSGEGSDSSENDGPGTDTGGWSSTPNASGGYDVSGPGGYSASTDASGNDISGNDFSDSSTGFSSDTSGDFTTESFEGGTVSYNARGDYSVTNADGTTHGYDSITGISYETAEGGKYGVTAINAEGTTVTYDTLNDMKAEIEENKLDTAKKAGMSIGSILGPAGMVAGYYLGGVAYEAINPEKVSTILGREQFSEEINAEISKNDITLSREELTAWQGGEDLTVGGGGSYTVGDSVTEPTTAPITEAEVQSNYLDYMKERQEEWDKVFGPVQDNLAEYYKGLTPESLEAREISAIQSSYQQQTKQLEQTLAQRGIGTSGLAAEGMSQLTQAAAQDKAALRATAPSRVAEEQLGFLKVGLGQEANIQSSISSAYAGEVQTDIAAGNLAAQQSAAKSTEKSAMYGALATAVTAFM